MNQKKVTHEWAGQKEKKPAKIKCRWKKTHLENHDVPPKKTFD